MCFRFFCFSVVSGGVRSFPIFRIQPALRQVEVDPVVGVGFGEDFVRSGVNHSFRTYRILKQVGRAVSPVMVRVMVRW